MRTAACDTLMPLRTAFQFPEQHVDAGELTASNANVAKLLGFLVLVLQQPSISAGKATAVSLAVQSLKCI